MNRDKMSVVLTDRQTREIEAFCQIAKENGATISLRELIGLASINVSEDELERAFLSDHNLRSKFLLESGYVLEKRTGADDEVVLHMVEEEDERRARALANLKSASRFGRLLLKGTVLVSVSGANSYLSAKEGDDIDFFCVTKTDGMWPFMLKALMLARIHRMTNSGVPELCFSCIMDERWAEQAFRQTRQPIFARDALTAKVIGGSTGYHALLEAAPWMGSFFPAFYDMRLRETTYGDRQMRRGANRANGESERRRERGSPVLNLFLYYTLGSFLRLKSWALNRKFTKTARHSAIFATKIGKGFYIYESNRYRKIRGMYGELEKDADK